MNYEAQLAAQGLRPTSGLRRLAAAAMTGASIKGRSDAGIFDLSFKGGQLIVTRLSDDTVCSSPVMLMSITPIPLASLTANPDNDRA